MTCPHEPDLANFRVMLPEDIDWNPFAVGLEYRDLHDDPRHQHA